MALRRARAARGRLHFGGSRTLPGVPLLSTQISWQELRRARAEAASRWPSPFRLPLVKRPSDLLYAALAPDDRVLDLGAGDDRRRERVRARFPGVRYVSVDTDPGAAADHATLSAAGAAADRPFDVAVLFEVLEHMPPEDGVAALRELRRLLRPGGRVLVSVPCTLTPGRFQRDCTHVTPYAHDELGAALLMAGFRLDALHRTYPGPGLRRLLRRCVLGPIGRAFGLDYAYSVVATGVVEGARAG